MGELFGCFIIIGFCWLMTIIPEKKFDNYLPPEGYEVDHAKMNYDLTTGVPKDVIKRRTTEGYYNKKKK